MRIIALLATTAPWGRAAKVPARSSAAATGSSQTRDTSPSDSASPAPTRLPLSVISIAAAVPTTRGSSQLNSAVRDQSHMNEGSGEQCVGSGQPQVTSECQSERRPHAWPIDCGDRGLGQVVQAADGSHRDPQTFLEVLPIQACETFDLIQVSAGAEGPSLTGEDQHMHRRVAGETLEHDRELVEGAAVQCVEPLRPVEDQQSHPLRGSLHSQAVHDATGCATPR